MQYKWMRLCSVLLVLGLMFCCGTTFAAELESWIDYAADGFAGGTGTEDDPYLIATAEQLAYLAKTVNNDGNNYKDKHFKLQQDIDLARYDWVAIGTRSDNLYENNDAIFRRTPAFLGNFDGNNKIIKNLTIKKSYVESGLFGLLGLGKVKNLALINVDIRSCFLGGGVAAQAQFAKIEKCYVSGKIEGFWCLGGIAGFSFSTEVHNSLLNIKIYLSERMPREFKLHHAKYYSFDSHTSLINTGAVAGGVLGYVTNFFGLDWPSIIDNCRIAWEIHGGHDLGTNAIAIKEGGTPLTITNCEIIPNLSY